MVTPLKGLIMQMASTPNTPELWKNVSVNGPTAVVWKLDHLGQYVDAEVRPGAVVAISARDREYNQALYSHPKFDLFKNGTLEPISAESDEAVEDLKSQIVDPVHNDDELMELLGLHWKTFDKRIEEMGNLVNLERLWEFIQDPEVGAKARQFTKVSDRIEALTGTPPERVQDGEGE